VYLSAKLITDANRTQLTEARPRAVISAFLLYDSQSGEPEGIVSVLNGDMMLSTTAHHEIHRAWFEMSAFRRHALAPILVSASHGRQIAFEVMHVTVSMMKWAQMSHAVFIAQLLAAEPWVESYSPLAAQVQLFKASAEKLKELPKAEVEFTRVIHGNRVGLFRRRDLAALVECALSDLRASTPTVGAYFSDPSYAPTVLAYQTEKARQHTLRAATAGAPAIAAAAPAAPLPPPPVVAAPPAVAPPPVAAAPAPAVVPPVVAPPIAPAAITRTTAVPSAAIAAGMPPIVAPIYTTAPADPQPAEDLLQLAASASTLQPPLIAPPAAGPSTGGLAQLDAAVAPQYRVKKGKGKLSRRHQ
jgi:hypothetical protein